MTKVTTPVVDARAQVLVNARWLEDHLDDARVRIVEVDVSPTAHREGHIPGAVLWDVYRDLKDSEYRLVDKTAIERLAERSGISRDSIVVLYGYAPAMGFWLMKLFGHADVRLLDVGRARWHRDGRPWTTGTEQPTETRAPLPDEDERLRARQPFVRESMRHPGRVIVDVRTEAEYRGERFWPSGGLEKDGRAGHIPSAVPVPADRLQDADGTFRSPGELQRVFSAVDRHDDVELITYCTIGARACTAWFVLTYLLGHRRTRVYDGSWAEWGRMPTAPVETSE